MTEAKNEAEALFWELTTYSHRYLKQLKCAAESPWQGDAFQPEGVIVHWTADISFDNVLRWFCQPRFKANVSAHFVVDRHPIPENDELAWDLPRVSALPARVVLCVPLDKRAWHATWVNGRCYGIEILNAGRLGGGRGMRRLSGRWGEYRAPTAWVGECEYDVYWPGQFQAVAKLVTALHALRPLNRSWVLGHRNIDLNKSDPGPLFPMERLRTRVFGSLEARVTSETTHVDFLLWEMGYDLSDRKTAVKIFQRMAGLTQDGIVGPQTADAIALRHQSLFF